MIDQVETLDIPAELKALAIEKLRNRADVAEFVRLIASGADHLFRFGGQSVPNRQEVSVDGVRVLLDNSAPERRAKQYAEYIRKHGTKSLADALSSLVTGEKLRAFIVGHELAHVVGRTAQTDEALSDDLGLCEEMKATLLSFVTICNSSLATQEEVIALIVARILHTMRQEELDDQTFQPYVREGLAMATILCAIGVIAVTDEGVALDSECAQQGTFLSYFCSLVERVIGAYHEVNVEVLKGIVRAYCDQGNPAVAALIAWVNRPTSS